MFLLNLDKNKVIQTRKNSGMDNHGASDVHVNTERKINNVLNKQRNSILGREEVLTQ